MEVQNVRVIVRIRPFLVGEPRESPLQVSQNAIQITTGEVSPRVFQFDNILSQSATQSQTFQAAAQDIVEKFTKGMNGCVLCYGQTSSGKTHTCGLNEQISDGIVYRSLYTVFNLLKDQKFDLQVIFVQIYNEQVSNLLQPNEQNLTVKEVSKNNFQIDNISVKAVTSLQQTLDLITAGLKNRKVAPTLANQNSSRAHTIFQLNLKVYHKSGYSVSKLQILDLAGSERIAKSKSEGDRFTEAVNINQSLSYLGKAVSALSTGKQFVPVRSSLLTKILSTTLMNNCRTVLIATLCPSINAAHESLSTLQFAKSCREIEQMAQFNTFGEVNSLGTDQASLQQMNGEQMVELKEICDLSGVQVKDSYTPAEVAKVVAAVKQRNDERIQLQADEDARLEQLKLDQQILAYRNRIEEIKRQQNVPHEVTQEAHISPPKPGFLSEPANFIYEMIQKVGQQIDELSTQLAKQPQAHLQSGNLINTLGSANSVVGQTINDFDISKFQVSGVEFVTIEQESLQQLSQLLQIMNMYQKYSDSLQIQDVPEFITGQKRAIKSEKTDRTQKYVLQNLGSFQNFAQFKLQMQQQMNEFEYRQKKALHLISDAKVREAEMKKLEGDYYQFAGRRAADLYNLSKVFEVLEANGV